MEKPALWGARKRKPSPPASGTSPKLPRTWASLLLLPEDPDPDAEQEAQPEGAAGRTPMSSLGSGEALDLSVSRQWAGAMVGAGAGQEDLGLLQRHSLTEGQKRGILGGRWLPPSSFQFPRRLMGSGAGQKYRRCSVQLLQDYPFAHYSRHLDGVFCGPCFVFSSNKEAILVSTPLKDWSNSKKILERHSRSKEHGWVALQTQAFAAVEHKKQLAERGQRALKQMVRMVLLCARQDLSLGGRLPVTKALDALSRSLAELDPLLREGLSQAPCGTPGAPEQLQEQLIQLIGLQIQDRVLARVRAAGFFSLLVDMSVQKNVILSLRYVHWSREGRVEIREDPVEFVGASDLPEGSLAELCLQRITAWGLRKELARGFSYHGPRSGQLARIRDVLPKAISSASTKHQMTTAILRSCSLRPVTKFLDTLTKVSLVLTSSAERLSPQSPALKAFLDGDSDPGEEEEEKDPPPEVVGGREGPQGPPPVHLLSSFRSEYPAILEALCKMAEDHGDAERLFFSITQFDFLVALVCVESVLSCMKPLQLDLQRGENDLIHLSKEAQLVLQRCQKMRDKEDPEFTLLYDDVRGLAASVGVAEAPPRICGRPVSLEAFSTEDLREGYRTSLFVPFLDHVIAELREQLLECSPRFLAQLLVPDRLPLLEGEGTEAELYDAFQGDIPDSDHFHEELQRWRARWTEVPRKDWPRSLLAALQYLSPGCYPGIHTALSVLATMPIGGPSGEQSSQVLRRAKTWQRSPGKGSRLTGLALMDVHRDMEVDTDQVLGDLRALAKGALEVKPLL
uniref:52 kDa repressor of the inhibitor of the protein kinase-like n=1 Tax=Monodelphis domestica TaxID=13616 RepID=K7E066_MONDO